ncbi:MAG: hypothetical protein ACREJO_03445 [Phycisphaerales bacterium]
MSRYPASMGKPGPDPTRPKFPEGFMKSLITAIVIGNLITVGVLYTISRIWWKNNVATPIEQMPIWNR